jgi:hypothetical protein
MTARQDLSDAAHQTAASLLLLKNPCHHRTGRRSPRASPGQRPETPFRSRKRLTVLPSARLPQTGRLLRDIGCPTGCFPQNLRGPGQLGCYSHAALRPSFMHGAAPGLGSPSHNHRAHALGSAAARNPHPRDRLAAAAARLLLRTGDHPSWAPRVHHPASGVRRHRRRIARRLTATGCKASHRL